MTSRQGRQAIAATAAMGVAVALALPTAAFAQSATQGKETATTTSSGTTYYVSSAHGDDANAGTSENAPWKSLTKVNDIASDLGPGDSVLLEYGSEFNDQYLHIKDTAGNADAPITISAYGDADEGKPVIASNGVKGSQWEQDYRANVGNHKNKGTVSTTLLLKDVSYITVSNLEITNDDADVYDPIDTWKWTDTPDSDGTKLDRSASRMDRTGVAGIAENGATMSNVTLDNLYIHDVDGNIYNKHMANGGIYFMAHYPMENTSAETDVSAQGARLTLRPRHHQKQHRQGRGSLGHRRRLHRLPQLHRRELRRRLHRRRPHREVRFHQRAHREQLRQGRRRRRHHPDVLRPPGHRTQCGRQRLEAHQHAGLHAARLLRRTRGGRHLAVALQGSSVPVQRDVQQPQRRARQRRRPGVGRRLRRRHAVPVQLLVRQQLRLADDLQLVRG